MKDIFILIGVLLALGGVVALAIATLVVIVWSFHVNFLYGVVALVGFELLAPAIVILLIFYR